MGRVNIYIQQKNERKWKAIPNKSEWVNKQLSIYDVIEKPKKLDKYGNPIED